MKYWNNAYRFYLGKREQTVKPAETHGKQDDPVALRFKTIGSINRVQYAAAGEPPQ